MRMRRPSIENGRFRPLSFTPALSCGPGVGLARDWVAQARALVAPIVLTLWSVTSLTAAILSSRAGLSYLFTLRFLALVITMAGSSLESSAVFEARAIELGLAVRVGAHALFRMEQIRRLRLCVFIHAGHRRIFRAGPIGPDPYRHPCGR